MRKLLDLTRALAKDNPGQAFFVDVEKAVSGAKNPETGEIVPILSGLIDGNVAAYHGVLVDGKAPEFAWRSLTCFTAFYGSVEELDRVLRDFHFRGFCPLEGFEQIIVEDGENYREFRKKLYGDWGPFEEVTK